MDKKAILPLRNFRASITHALAKKAKLPRKRGQPSFSPPQPAKHPRVTAATRPVEDVRRDDIGHWPVHSEKKMRCKLCATGFTRIKCSKCDLGLCLNSNYFVDFHTK